MSFVLKFFLLFRRIIFRCVRYIVYFYCIFDDIFMFFGISFSKWGNFIGRKRKKVGRGKLEGVMFYFSFRSIGVRDMLLRYIRIKSRSLVK